MNKRSPFIFYFLVFAGFASIAPFMVLFYQSVGFTGTQIGLISGITPLITLLAAPFWTSLADATRRHSLVMSFTLLMGALTIFLFPFLNTFATLLLLAILFNAFFAPISSLADSAIMFMLANKKEMYGRIRLGGTLGFGIAAPLAGVLVQKYGLELAFWACAILFLLALPTSRKLVYNTHRASDSTRQSFRALLRRPRWLLFLMVAFAGGLSLAGTNTYLFPYLKELGANESTMGLALTIGTLSEIPVLFYGHHLVKRLRPYGLLILASIFTAIRLLAFAASTTPTLALLVQMLNGFTFPAMWIAGVAYADENAPTGLSATAQGLFGAMVFGFGNAVGGFMGGPLLDTIGGRGIYFVFGSIILAIVGIAVIVEKLLPPEPAAASPAGLD